MTSNSLHNSKTVVYRM